MTSCCVTPLIPAKRSWWCSTDLRYCKLLFLACLLPYEVGFSNSAISSTCDQRVTHSSFGHAKTRDMTEILSLRYFRPCPPRTHLPWTHRRNLLRRLQYCEGKGLTCLHPCRAPPRSENREWIFKVIEFFKVMKCMLCINFDEAV